MNIQFDVKDNDHQVHNLAQFEHIFEGTLFHFTVFTFSDNFVTIFIQTRDWENILDKPFKEPLRDVCC